ncbi:Ppx/GppA phosphatase family protein [Colwellia sp. Bg11-12]|uniref:Ppx/GppA phosphatase family protein n=1 Tax=Colwellia sp. Bg11-12 TaxID=2759817 RepID=UPI0015F3E40A|nr:Ppx/GppA phosphatase family protein [Colwellia sp. Bg11-12]MBA6263027.1 Ppx/GppA family phosphatase [Colwellia sp. Bg11-12]
MMQKSPTTTNEQHITQDYFAALDIGSNSFHFVLARKIGEHLQILHSEKYRVKLAQGLDKDNNLSAEAIYRGVKTLDNIASSAAHIHRENFRIVATHSLRKAKNIETFLQQAAKVFPYDIEIISGHEEARLIYQGVVHHCENFGQQLIIDIGGGSTECIIGNQQEIMTLASLNIGCVSYTQSYFADGLISEEAFKKAIRAAKHEIDSVIKRFKNASWQSAIGTSGTFKNIYKVLNNEGKLPQPFTLKQLYTLKKQLLEYRHYHELNIDGLKEDRQELICAGVAIAIALMECLEINALDYCQYALREGVLYEQLENLTLTHINNNTRQRSVNNLAMRFNVDQTQVSIIQNVLKIWLTQVENKWVLSSPVYTELLMFAAQLHELGIDINPSGYQKHGQYILTHSDLAGFNQEQQQALAWLVGNQRKKITPLTQYQWYLLNPESLKQICSLLRLAILLSQQRQDDTISPVASVNVSSQSLTLQIDQHWLLNRPIVDTELFYEQAAIATLGIDLKTSIDDSTAADF